MEQNTKIIIAALVIMLGGNASNFIGAANPNQYRPDPFTGLDGAKLEARMSSEDKKLELAILRLKYKLQACKVK